MNKILVMHDVTQGHGIVRALWDWAKPLLADGRKLTVKVSEQKRTLDQNSLIHPVVAEIAKAAGKPTDKSSLQTLRYLLLEQWRHETERNPVFERSLDGMRWVQVQSGTSDLDKPDCSEFIEWMTAFKEQHS